MHGHQAFARAALITTCCLAPLAAAAAEAADEAATIEEVVVMARKQGETLLDAPATISVVRQEALEAASITNANQLSGLIPGLVTMQGTAGTSANFRGLGSSGADPSIESSVATFVDGVYLGHTRDFIMPLYDVAQVELIKGTQSTLLGKNTSLGAVSISNRRPGAEFGYDVAVTHSTGIDATRVLGGVDLPLGGGFAVRLAGLFNDEDGYVHNRYLGRKERTVDEVSGRLTLAGPVGDTADVTLVYQRDDRESAGHYFELLTDPNGVVTERALLLGQTPFEVGGDDNSYSGSDAGAPGDLAGPLQSDSQKGDRLTFTGNAKLGELNLTAVTAWLQWKSARATDLDFTGARLIDFEDREKNAVFSQELRVASPQGERLSWLAGVYYYNNKWRLQRSATAQEAGGVFPISGGYSNVARIRTEAWSAFASARFALTEQVTLSAGARYTDEEKTPTYIRTSSGFFTLEDQNPPIPFTTLAPLSSKELDGDVGVQYRPNDRTMLYATWSRGSKSGGFQAVPTTLGAARFEGETAYTTEVGAKFQFPGGGYLTAAVFETRVEDFQVNRVQIVDGQVQTTIGNADIRSRGAEASGAWEVADGLTLDASVVYADAEFRKDFPDVAPLEAFKGMPLVRAPKWSAKAGGRYVRDLTDNLDLRIQGALTYASDADLQPRAGSPLAPISKAHTLLDAQIAVGDRARGWELAVIGTNLTDERYVVFSSNVPVGGEAFYGARNRPRIIALQLKLTR